MSSAEKCYLFCALYSVFTTTILLYLLFYKINLDNIRRKKDEREKYKRRIDRENNRRELLALSREIHKIYYDVIGGVYKEDKND